jgi:hypothetical protein
MTRTKRILIASLAAFVLFVGPCFTVQVQTMNATIPVPAEALAE